MKNTKIIFSQTYETSIKAKKSTHDTLLRMCRREGITMMTDSKLSYLHNIQVISYHHS